MNSNQFRIRLASPEMADEELEAVRTVLLSGRLVKGPFCRALEEALQRITSRRYAVAVSSGSMALLAAMKGMGIGPGHTVAVPALTFPAPAFIAAFLGATVRAVDVDPETFNVSRRTLLEGLDGSVDLVVAIDQFGLPVPVPDIQEALASYGIPVLVDAACSIGAALDGAPAGSLGMAATLSFHPRKVITTGEGGAVLTDDEGLAGEVRRWVDQGVENGTFKTIGLNLRLGELNCAIGVKQLERLEAFVERRRRLAKRYAALPLRFQTPGKGASSNYQTLAAMLPSGAVPADRDDLVRHLREGGIEATIASYCLGTVPGIRRALMLDDATTPVAREIHELGIALPLHPGLTEREVDEVIEVVHNWLKKKGLA